MTEKESKLSYIKQRTIESVDQYDIYLNDEIKPSEKYVELLNILNTSKENDKINIYLNNNGGYLDTAIQIINYIEDCK